MIALDTNVLVRFFVNDPNDSDAARQRPAAADCLGQRAFVTVTVLLEFEWVLRGFYKLPRADILRILRALASLEHVSLENRGSVLIGLDAFARGLDFADALHVARSSRASAFRTFDRRLAKAAQREPMPVPIELMA